MTAQREKTVTVALDDPFSSLFQPSYVSPEPSQKPRSAAAFASAEINSSHKAQTFLPPTVQPTFNDPLLQPRTLDTQYVPKSDYIKAQRSARDGWFAAMFLGGVVALGTYWVVDRVGQDNDKIDGLNAQVADLNSQITTERGVVTTRNKEVQLLNEQLADERGRSAKLLKTAKR
jgi:hypothetical protein